MRLRPTALATAVMVVVALLGCACTSDGSGDGGVSPTTVQPNPLAESLSPLVEEGPPLGQRQTEPAPGMVRLWVSNQSFEDDPVRLTISIDGTPVVNDDFEVQGQHNWIPFDISGLTPGAHAIVAESDTGAQHLGEFTVLVGEARWLVLDYWYYPDSSEGRYFTLTESDHAVGFA